ncbi:MAG: hypothetical protein JWQ38_2797 [Flavipsychrobacter sp.]|nr:hypothetical protein [Flavipsychrobacter sp.]
MQEQRSSISSFKRFLLRILLPLLCIIVVAGSAFNYLFEKMVIMKSESGEAYKVHRIINEHHPDEIAILGSSRAESGYIPDSLGENFFNYGIRGSKYDVTLFFLEEECKKKKNRPWVILNIDMDGLRTGRFNPGVLIPSAYHPSVKKLLADEYRPYHALQATRFFGHYETYIREYLKMRVLGAKLSNKGASLERLCASKQEFDSLVSERKKTPTAFELDTALLARMNTLIATHPDRYFIFVLAPLHSSCFEKFTNEQEVYSFFDRLNAMRNVHVFNFSKLPLADSMFLNTSHVSYNGAAVFSHLLRDSLIALGVK